MSMRRPTDFFESKTDHPTLTFEDFLKKILAAIAMVSIFLAFHILFLDFLY
jgi:hypothetical protein